MASELSKFFEEISSEKSKFAEKVKNDTDLQSMFSQIAELKKESDKRKEEVEKKYAVPNLEESNIIYLTNLSIYQLITRTRTCYCRLHQ